MCELIDRIKFWRAADRIGPDIPWTHWRLHFPSKMLKLCKSKFKHFDNTAQFRPGAYAMGCSKISIGRRVVIRPLTMLCASTLKQTPAGGITIEDDVLIANGVQIHTDQHIFDNPDIPIFDQGYVEPEDVVIQKGSWIGANSVILKGVTIGENTVIGAGSVVVKNIPSRTVAAGVPARVIREITKDDLSADARKAYIDTGVRWYNEVL